MLRSVERANSGAGEGIPGTAGESSNCTPPIPTMRSRGRVYYKDVLTVSCLCKYQAGLRRACSPLERSQYDIVRRPSTLRPRQQRACKARTTLEVTFKDGYSGVIAVSNCRRVSLESPPPARGLEADQSHPQPPAESQESQQEGADVSHRHLSSRRNCFS